MIEKEVKAKMQEGFAKIQPKVVESSKITPTTKEQRDTLFAKMHEAGYMWDSESKQLLSLKAEPSGEQKPAWSEEDERLCSCLIKDQEEALDDVYNDKYGHSEIISDLKEMYRERINWLISLKQRIGG